MITIYLLGCNVRATLRARYKLEANAIACAVEVMKAHPRYELAHLVQDGIAYLRVNADGSTAPMQTDFFAQRLI